MPYIYEISLREVSVHGGGSIDPEIRLEVTNHDDIRELILRVQKMHIIPEGEAAEFVVGLKLFTEVLIRHRREPLFAELWPHIGTFMKNLKGKGMGKI